MLNGLHNIVYVRCLFRSNHRIPSPNSTRLVFRYSHGHERMRALIIPRIRNHVFSIAWITFYGASGLEANSIFTFVCCSWFRIVTRVASICVGDEEQFIFCIYVYIYIKYYFIEIQTTYTQYIIKKNIFYFCIYIVC